MNQTKLVHLIKTLVNEAHHGTRYFRNPKVTSKLRVPDKQLQVAEEDGEKVFKGKTDTGGEVEINVNPKLNSRVEPIHGVAKPQTDTK